MQTSHLHFGSMLGMTIQNKMFVLFLFYNGNLDHDHQFIIHTHSVGGGVSKLECLAMYNVKLSSNLLYKQLLATRNCE